MAKRKRKRRASTSQRAQAPTDTKPKTVNAPAVADAPYPKPEPSSVDTSALEQRIREELEQKHTKLTKERERLEALSEELRLKKQEQDVRAQEQEKRHGEQERRDTALRARELNAENGFTLERGQMLTEVESARASLREEIASLQGERDQQRNALLAEEQLQRQELSVEFQRLRDEFREGLQAERDAHDASLRGREDRLRAHEEDLEQRRDQLDRAQRDVAFEQEDVRELREHLEERAEQISARRVEALEHRVNEYDELLSQARSDRDRHAQTLRERAEADRRFGQRTPDEVLQALEQLRRERDELSEELRQRLSGDDQVRLESLIEEQRQWRQERQELLRSQAELTRRLEYTRSQALELETQRDVIGSLEGQRELLREANRQVRAEIDDLIARSEAESAFPACTDMDSDPGLQTTVTMSRETLQLDSFVEDLRHRIAQAHDDRELFYTHEDLRAFVGGLAMGRLLLLQGISGTGKTSLPLAFARAVGGTASVVEVQAGWRDPQDLVGHYNNFEKRFHEKEFLQALYRAQTPRWQEALHIVLLDEMNLSHPEQYFSDMLSTLEREPDERQLNIMTHAVPQPPRLFREGRALPIPQNVWFVGTANHDETTKNFADKTYDRSHVQEFPHRPEPFSIRSMDPMAPLTYASLRDAFETAIKRHEDVAAQAIRTLNDHLRGPLTENFGIGWGPRLERQISRYIPVVHAAGGASGEALDHILATRLIRKLRHRHDNRPEHLQELRETVLIVWDDFASDPKKSVDMLDSELRRLGVEV